MKKVFFLLSLVISFFQANSQNIDIQLWGDDTPVAFQCHTEGVAGDYGKMVSDQQLEFWETDTGGIDMRWSTEAVYGNGRMRSACYIYHGKREGDKIVFTTYEDGDAMEGTAEIETLDPTFQPTEVTILNPKQVEFDRCTYNKMKMDFTKGTWVKF